jgi:hypothetical protein
VISLVVLQYDSLSNFFSPVFSVPGHLIKTKDLITLWFWNLQLSLYTCFWELNASVEIGLRSFEVLKP